VAGPLVGIVRRSGFISRRAWSRAVAVVAGLLAAAPAPPPAGNPDAGQILQRAEEIRSPQIDYTVDFRLRAVDPNSSWKERTAAYTMIAHGKDYSLVVMREPKQFYPGTLLIREGLYWLLLPRSERPFQLAPRHVLNGDISNGDLARGNLIAYYDVRLDGEETVRGEPCWRLELTRARNLALYKRIRGWITKRDFRPWTFEYYGETGALLKIAHYEDYRKTPLGVRSMRIEVENRIRPGERTTLTFSDLREFDASKLTYTPQALREFRDAALSVLDAGGGQVKAEELLTILGGEEP